MLRAWAGLYEVNLFDHSGIIGLHPQVQNLVLMYGSGRHGMMHSPAASAGASELIVHGRSRSIDLGALCFELIAANRPTKEHVFDRPAENTDVNVLIVYAHPEPTSFNAAMKDVAVETLTALGHVVVISDLYAMGFSAVLGAGDFLGPRVNDDVINPAIEQTHAFEAGTLAPEIVAEQAKIAAADLLILQFPIWWFGMPAIMKGWADRVFARGFAYVAGRKYDTGLMRGKTAMVAATTGTSADTYAPDGIDGDILSVLWPVHNGLLRYTGFDVLPPHVVYMPGRIGATGREAGLEAYRHRLRELETTPRLFFHPLEDYGPNERLKPGVLARSGVQRNP